MFRSVMDCEDVRNAIGLALEWNQVSYAQTVCKWIRELLKSHVWVYPPSKGLTSATAELI